VILAVNRLGRKSSVMLLLAGCRSAAFIIGAFFCLFTSRRRDLPGTRIPVMHPDRIFERKPDYVLILPWNIKDEIIGQMAGIRDWGGQFVVPMPRPTVC